MQSWSVQRHVVNIETRDERGELFTRCNQEPMSLSEELARSGAAVKSSDFIGVSWNKNAQRWRVCATIEGKVHRPYFHNELEAARAHDDLV